MKDSLEKVAIIGSGAAGLVAAKEMLQVGLQVTVYEQHPHLGGVWQYTPGQSIMYGSLRTNLPKEIMAYDHQHPFKSTRFNPTTGNEEEVPSFITYIEVMQYLEDFANQYHLFDHIKFGREVVTISYNDDNNHNGLQHRWKVITRCATTNNGTLSSSSGHDHQSTELYEDYFDAIIVCNGHFNIPHIPTIPGYHEYFQGERYHSIDYERIKPMLTKRKILIVGTKSSGTDMARELSQQEGNEIIVSDRNYSSSQPFQCFDNITIYPSIASFDIDGKTVHFQNKTSSSDVDTILWCTGFQYDYPFLSSSLTSSVVHVENHKRLRPLYQHLFAIEDNTLSFIGLPFTVVPFIIFALQSKWIAKVYSRQVSLPSKSEQYSWLEKEEDSLRSFGLFDEKYHFMGAGKQWKYDRFLVETANLNDPLLSSYITACEQIYDDTVIRRPQYTGAADTYRSREYRFNQ